MSCTYKIQCKFYYELNNERKCTHGHDDRVKQPINPETDCENFKPVGKFNLDKNTI